MHTHTGSKFPLHHLHFYKTLSFLNLLWECKHHKGVYLVAISVFCFLIYFKFLEGSLVYDMNLIHTVCISLCVYVMTQDLSLHSILKFTQVSICNYIILRYLYNSANWSQIPFPIMSSINFNIFFSFSF